MKIKKSIALIIPFLMAVIIAVSLNSCNVDLVIPQTAEAHISHIEFANIIGTASIDILNQTIIAEIADRPNSDMEHLVLIFRLSNGATAYVNNVAQISGATVNDFSAGDVEYKVVSGDGKTTKNWSITILKRRDTATYQLSGLIKENTILAAAIYEVNANIEIAEKVYFAVEAGSTFKLAPCVRIILNSESKLFANGTEALPIRFTSMNENSEFGNGAWSDIYIKNSTAEFTHCIFENGGGCNNRPLMYLENSEVGVRFSTFRNILNTGIYLDANSMFRIFDNNRIENCGETVDGCYPIHYKNINTVLNVRSNNIINTSKGIFIETANISTNLTFSEQICPYIIGGNITNSGDNTVVFVQPGVSFVMNNGSSINLGGNASIRFVAQGTKTNPIKFSSKENQKGSWEGITFGSRILSGSLLEYCEINNAGNSETSGAIKCIGTDSTRLSIKNCIIRNPNSHGIFIARNSTVRLGVDENKNQFVNIPFGFIDIYYQP